MKLTKARVAALVGAVAGSLTTMMMSTWITGCSDSKADPQDVKKWTQRPRVTGADAEPVAIIDGVVITVADFRDRLNKQSPYIRARYTSLERKKEFLDNLVRFEVLAKEAERRGLGEDPEVVRTMKQVMIQKLMQDEFDNRVKVEDITDKEMRDYYTAHSTDYNQPEQVRVSAIVIKKDSKLADRLAEEVKGPKGQDNRTFRDMVLQYSEDEDSKVRGGDLRYFDETSQEVPAEVIKASFALEKVGDVAGPIKTSKGMYILKQTGRRKALSRTFEEVQRQIQNRLYREKRTNVMDNFVEGLRKAAKVQVFDQRISKIQVDMTGSLPSDSPMPGDPAVGSGVVPPPGADPSGNGLMPGTGPDPALLPNPGPGGSPAIPPAPPVAPGSPVTPGTAPQPVG